MQAAEYTDVPEGYEFYDGVHYAAENGLMAAVSDTEFGAENPATAGELLEGLSQLLAGSPMSAADLKEMLAPMGYLPADLDVDAELTEQLLCDILNPLGAHITTDTPDKVMSRGELADLLMQFYAQ